MINFLRIGNNIKVGDYLHSDGTIDNIISNDIIGVCVIPSDFLPDRRARFVSMAAMDSRNKEKGSHIVEHSMVWYSDGAGYEDFLTQRRRVPIDCNLDGIIEGYTTWGRVPLLDSSNSDLTIDNPQDPGTKYFSRLKINRIPSPYAPDGSFNPNFHSRGSEKDDWALTDYRGDLNTRDVICSEKSREDYCPAFYCCNEFSPGYRDHEWYLPAVGELAFIPPRFEIIRSKMKEAVNAGSPGVILSARSYWSSSEYDCGHSWYVSLEFGSVSFYGKDGYNNIRAFLAI